MQQKDRLSQHYDQADAAFDSMNELSPNRTHERAYYKRQFEHHAREWLVELFIRNGEGVATGIDKLSFRELRERMYG